MTIKQIALHKYVSIFFLLISSHAQAALFVSTGQTGAQVQVDIAHTQNWEFTPGVDIDIDGAKFKMKRGPSTSDDVSFTLIEGIFADWNTGGTVISDVSLVVAPFTQQFEFYDFFAPVTLQAGTTYTGILWSDAIDTQSTAYFVKRGTGELGLVDENGDVVTEPPLDPSVPPLPVSEPITLALLSIGIAGIGFQRRFKKVALQDLP